MEAVAGGIAGACCRRDDSGVDKDDDDVAFGSDEEAVERIGNDVEVFRMDSR